MPNESEHPCISVSLKEFINVKIAGLKELWTAELKGRDIALALQAAEYERRLEALNHEHEKNQARNNEFVSDEKFEGLETEVRRIDSASKEGFTKMVTVPAFESHVKEFNEYKTTTAEALALAKSGARAETDKALSLKAGSTKVLALIVSIMLFLWATSSVISTVSGIYQTYAPKYSISESEVSHLRQQNADMLTQIQTNADNIRSGKPAPVTVVNPTSSPANVKNTPP
jgi:hypothetical protein